MSTKDFAEIQVDELIECVRKFENGRATNDSLILHRKNTVLAIRARVPSPHTEDFPDMRDQFAMAALPAIIEANKENMKISFTGEAEQAYKYADAMMAARKASSTPEGAA